MLCLTDLVGTFPIKCKSCDQHHMMQIQIKKLVAQCMSEAKHCNKLSKELLLLRTEVQQVVTKCKKWRVNYKLVFYLKEDQRHLATIVILAQVTVMHIVSTHLK